MNSLNQELITIYFSLSIFEALVFCFLRRFAEDVQKSSGSKTMDAVTMPMPAKQKQIEAAKKSMPSQKLYYKNENVQAWFFTGCFGLLLEG